MRLIVSLILVSIGLVAAGTSAWKEGKEYQYKLRIYTKNNKEGGTAAQANLTIQPQSDNLLIGKISNALYGNTDQPFPGDGADLIEILSEYDEWKLNRQQFKIHLEDGVIRALSVDPSLTSNEINQLKTIVSQLQVNTKAEKNLSSSNEVDRPAEGNNVSYKVMEPTVFGNCETSYDISPLPNYLLQSHPALAPRKGAEELLQIEKTRNLRNCMERNQSENNLNSSDGKSRNPAARARIVISGDLNDYTIQSVYATSPALDLYEHIGIALESVRESVNFREMLEDKNLTREDIDLTKLGRSEWNRSETFGLANVASCKPAPDAEERETTTCWTGFVDPDAQCKNDFDAQWTRVGGAGCCGFLCLGQRQRCRKSFPGCVETVCYSAAFGSAAACKDEYKDGYYPIPCGGSTNCSPGFLRVRCCPKEYE